MLFIVNYLCVSSFSFTGPLLVYVSASKSLLFLGVYDPSYYFFNKYLHDLCFSFMLF